MQNTTTAACASASELFASWKRFLQPDTVARSLVIEAEIGTRVPDFAQTSFESDPLPLACTHWSERPLLLVRGLQGIAREQMLEIREDELLMLLLVMQSQLNQPGNFRGQSLLGEQGEHGLVDVMAILEDILQPGA